jgi:hypothetical protein
VLHLGLGREFTLTLAARGIVGQPSFREAEARAIEFMLEHRLHRSDNRSEMTSPVYVRVTPAIRDERLGDAIGLLQSKRKPNGLWPLQKRIPGTLLVEMEKPGGESRWNTLRALRVLRRRS